jgi:hypothetical protein
MNAPRVRADARYAKKDGKQSRAKLRMCESAPSNMPRKEQTRAGVKMDGWSGARVPYQSLTRVLTGDMQHEHVCQILCHDGRDVEV